MHDTSSAAIADCTQCQLIRQRCQIVPNDSGSVGDEALAGGSDSADHHGDVASPPLSSDSADHHGDAASQPLSSDATGHHGDIASPLSALPLFSIFKMSAKAPTKPKLAKPVSLLSVFRKRAIVAAQLDAATVGEELTATGNGPPEKKLRSVSSFFM